MKGKVRKARHPQHCLPFILHPGAMAEPDSYATSLVLLVFDQRTLIFCSMYTLPAVNQKLSYLCCALWSFSLDAGLLCWPVHLCKAKQSSSEGFPMLFTCTAPPQFLSKGRMQSLTLPCHSATNTPWTCVPFEPAPSPIQWDTQCIFPSHPCCLFSIPVSIKQLLLLPLSRSLW